MGGVRDRENILPESLPHPNGTGQLKTGNEDGKLKLLRLTCSQKRDFPRRLDPSSFVRTPPYHPTTYGTCFEHGSDTHRHGVYRRRGPSRSILTPTTRRDLGSQRRYGIRSGRTVPSSSLYFKLENPGGPPFLYDVSGRITPPPDPDECIRPPRRGGVRKNGEQRI